MYRLQAELDGTRLTTNLEFPSGIEPDSQGFADLCITILLKELGDLERARTVDL